MDNQGCFNGQVRSQGDGEAFSAWWSYKEAVLVVGGWSQIPGNPAALRTSGSITALDSPKKGVRREQGCGCTEVHAGKRGKNWEKTPRMFPRNSSMPATFQAKLSLAFHAGEAMEWRAGIDNKGA